MIEKNLAIQIIESLRNGIPPQIGVKLYSVGNEKLIDGIVNRLLPIIGNRGIIRFTSGSWGIGKTHFFRLLKDVVFENNCLVSNVELNINSAALNNFGSIFYSIVRNISSPYNLNSNPDIAPFGYVVKESLVFLSRGSREMIYDFNSEDFQKAKTLLMSCNSIDIDFKKMIVKFWETYLPETNEPVILEQIRSEILQWFSGEGTIGMYRKKFDVNKIVNKENSKIMLQSLAGFVKLSGYNGLVILFDEAEQSYSIMRKLALKDAHNNLLSLINNVESLPALFLIYATTPDFYTDPKHGIVIYGALSGRIGKPNTEKPKALDTIWNLDANETTLEAYQEVSRKIKNIYITAFPDITDGFPSDEEVNQFVNELYNAHPAMSPVGFWRVLVTATVAHFDDHLEGEIRKTQKVYDDIIEKLKED